MSFQVKITINPVSIPVHEDVMHDFIVVEEAAFETREEAELLLEWFNYNIRCQGDVRIYIKNEIQIIAPTAEVVEGTKPVCRKLPNDWDSIIMDMRQ